ncbi:Prolow-density lipoprotein receptor-related protein 1 [Aphelenchoides fujianensis]|nr:Prolow-density lipoprotein receptor-related protein 1 [Aphelenchoides fujianensis]
MRSLLLVVFSLLQLGSATAECEVGDLACVLDAANLTAFLNDTVEGGCSFGACSQQCEELGGEPRCTCAQGFQLQADGSTCRSTATDPPFLLFTDRYSIRLVRLDHKEEENKTHLADDNVGESLPLLSYLKNTVALDYCFDHSDDSLLLFWADISTDQVTRARLKHGVLGDIEAIVTYGVWTPEGLAVDWMGRSVYWVDSMLKQIQVTKFDGSMTATVVNGGMQNPRALALDSTHGLLFWTLWDEGNPRIERATMAGEDRRVLVSIRTEDPTGGWPNGLTCDYFAERLYWIDAKSDSIHSVRYDGGDRRLVLRNSPGNELAHPFAITTFEEHVFWTDWRSRSLYKASAHSCSSIHANKFNGSNIEVLSKENLNQPFDLKVVHSSRQPTPPQNPCADNGGCSHLCLLNERNERKCACPHLFALEHHADPTRCYPINQTLLLATSNAITAVDSDYPNRVVFPLLSTGPASNITAIGVNAATSTVLWADGVLESINAFSLREGTRTEPRIVVKSDAPNCFGIAVDEAEGNVYFSTWDWAAAKIRVVSNGGVVRTLLTSDTFSQLRKPKDLVYKDGRLYWLDRGLQPHHPRLLQCGADGRKPSELKISDPDTLQDAHSLTAYGTDVLLWSASNITYSLNLTTMKLESVQMRTATNSNVDLVASDARLKEFLLYDRQNASVTGRLLINGHLSNMSRPLRDDVRGLVSMKLMLRDPRARELETETRAQCLKLNCDHFCLRVSDTRRCFCADSFLLSNETGQCELPRDRLLMLSSLGDLHWIVKPTNRSAELSAVQLSSEWNNQPQPRYFALGNGKIFYILTRPNQLWSFDWKTKTSSKLMDGGVFSLTSVAVDGRSGFVYVGTFRKKQALYPTARGMIVVLNPEFADLRKTTSRRTTPSSRCGYLFWKSTFALRRSRLDGSEVVRFPLKRSISDLAVDPRTRRLLLLPFGGSISILDYDFRELATRWTGMQNRTESGLVSYDSIAVGPHSNSLDSFLYFATRQQLWRVPLKEGPISIQVDEPDAAKAVSVCATADCEQFCFEMDDKAKCECAYSQLGADGRSCHRFSSFIAYVHGASVEFAPTIDKDEPSKLSVNGELNRKEAEVLQPIRNSSLFRAPVALAADEERRFLYVSDVQMDRIVAVTLNQTTSSVVVDGVKKVEGLAPSFPLEREDAVRGLAVNPCTSTLVFTNWRRDAPKIERLDLESGKRDVLIETDIRTPNAVAFDHSSRKIYWADAAWED